MCKRRRRNCITHVLELWKIEYTSAYGAYSTICHIYGAEYQMSYNQDSKDRNEFYSVINYIMLKILKYKFYINFILILTLKRYLRTRINTKEEISIRL